VSPARAIKGTLALPDMRGADLLVQRMKPAYRHAAAITTLAGFICDDVRDGLCDRGPCS